MNLSVVARHVVAVVLLVAAGVGTVVIAGGAGTGTPGAVQPVVSATTVAAAAPAQSVVVWDRASADPSPTISLVLSSVLVAAGVALLFVLRRRLPRR